MIEPLCSACVVNDMKAWFYGQTLRKNIILNIHRRLKGLLRQIESPDYFLLSSATMLRLSIKRCIACKKEMSPICFYCVIRKVSVIVKENVPAKSIRRSFNESFNTDLYDYNLHKK